jgi:hypothetical protein
MRTAKRTALRVQRRAMIRTAVDGRNLVRKLPGRKTLQFPIGLDAFAARTQGWRGQGAKIRRRGPERLKTGKVAPRLEIVGPARNHWLAQSVPKYAEQRVFLQEPVCVGRVADQVRGDVRDVVSEKIASHSADAAADCFQCLKDRCSVNEPLLEYDSVEQQVTRPQ